MTNADDIRSMSDEELLKMFNALAIITKCNFFCNSECTSKSCKEAINTWLQKEVDPHEEK